jgi:hypothetical protein
MDLVSYWKQLAQEAGFSAEESEKVLKVLSDQKATKTFNDEFVPRPTFHSQLDRQREDLKKLYEDNYKQWYERDVTSVLSTKDKELAQERAKVNAFEQTYGKLENFQQTQDPNVMQSAQTGDYISKKDLEALLAAREQTMAQNTVNVLKTAVKASGDHMKRFNEPLDVDAWEKFAVENNLPPALAYEKFIEPKVKELEAKAFDERIKREREDAVKDFATKNKFAVDSKPRELSPLSARLSQKKEDHIPQTDREKFELFREAWNEAAEAS